MKSRNFSDSALIGKQLSSVYFHRFIVVLHISFPIQCYNARAQHLMLIIARALHIGCIYPLPLASGLGSLSLAASLTLHHS